MLMYVKLKVEITIDGTPITHFSSFHLQQGFNAHQSFKLLVSQDIIEKASYIPLEKTREFMGKTISVRFAHGDEPGTMFKGLVTRVALSQNYDRHSDVVISGFSPCILLERGPDLGSYRGKSLDEIVCSASQGIAANVLAMKIKPVRKPLVDYIIQYRESDYTFLNRLSGEYHEWFFYDGQKLCFGKPDSLEELDMVYGKDLHCLDYAMQVAPISQQRFAYNPRQDALMSAWPEDANGYSSDTQHAMQASRDTFGKTFNQPMDVRAITHQDVDAYVNNDHKARISELIKVTGKSDNPNVALGKKLVITISKRGPKGFFAEDFGSYMVTSVTHHIDEVGKYENTFEAVSSKTQRLSAGELTRPRPDLQLATVTSNDDPDALGRVQVKFKWSCTTNDDTEWLRILSPSAGSDDQGSPNRGFMAIPETGDQVLVGFEEGNISRPVVMGSVYHSKNGSSRSQKNNHLKSIGTRSGHLIAFDDSPGSQGISITDRAGNQVLINTTDNSMQITALGKMTLTAKSLSIQVEEDMHLAVGGNRTDQAGGDKKEIVKGNLELQSKNMTQNVLEDLKQTAGKKHNQQASEIQISSTEGKILVDGKGQVVVQSKDKVHYGD